MEGLAPESIFGGGVLIFLLGLLTVGKLRFEREVERELKAKDEIIAIKDETISEQRQTIETLTTRDEVTHHLLQELRDLALQRSGGA